MDGSRFLCSLGDLKKQEWTNTFCVHVPAGPSAWAWMARDLEGRFVAVVPDRRARSVFSAAYGVFNSGRRLFSLADLPLAQDGLDDDALLVRRGETLRQWARSDDGVLVSTPMGLMAPFSFSDGGFRLGCGVDVGRERFLLWLSENGYERSDIVWKPGHYVSRGGIIDVYDPSSRMPVRVEFFDETVESLRFFSSRDQRSMGRLEAIDIRSLKGAPQKGLELFMDKDFSVVYCEPVETSAGADSFAWLWESLSEKPVAPELMTWDKVRTLLSAGRNVEIERQIRPWSLRSGVMELPPFRGNLAVLNASVKGWASEGLDIELFGASPLLDTWSKEQGVSRREGFPGGGFLDRNAGRVLLSEEDVLGTGYFREDPVSETSSLPDWDIAIGDYDYVVHDDYGIARNLGIERVTSGGVDRDCLVLEFGDERRLYLPVTQLDRITPYAPQPGETPRLDAMKGRSWSQAARRARKKAREAALNLMQLYAKRETAPGFAFASDGELLAAFEAGFPFAETRDQVAAIRSVKRDMENATPMDRLLVGDVGFGKTEVALRAAVKAAESGKQAVFLVPTTLLAQQHYSTLLSRTAGLPLKVEVLSRFTPQSRQKEIRESIASGNVDIVVGTHRLLQKDMGFRDIGLVIIDEEHRFGVLHKDHFKNIDPSVDILTLSATPIPRTLQMALGGIRDISLISTSPFRKHPVITTVGPWNEYLVRQAVLREKARGGQVFFVHNRVVTIASRAAMLKTMFPGLKISVAHGQMDESRLEKTMSDFSAGDTDMLVCTTIIESGLDIPNANTLIVDDVQNLGLAQIYQLRGRVGRREEQAFAFFFHPEDAPLAPGSRQRIEAITDLNGEGAGYRLARRDLEIRGGGRVAGVDQHGHTERVGFTLYYRMLEEEIAKLRSGEGAEPVQLSIRVPVTVPASYIPQAGVRIALFRRLLLMNDDTGIESVHEEIRDRFGPVPESVQFILACASVRLRGNKHGVQYVQCSQRKTVVSGKLSSSLLKSLGSARWINRTDGASEGPGGYAGMMRLAKMM